MSDYTGILFDSNNEEDIDEITGYLIEELDFDMCIQGKELPGYLLMKPGKDPIELLSQKISTYCKKEKLELSNLFLFHTTNFFHETDAECK